MLAKLCLLAAMLIPTLTEAQDADARFFRLDFVVKEVEAGKTLTSRAYSSLISTEKGFESISIRTGSKIPVPQGGNFTYIELGVSLDCRNPQLIENRLALYVAADISSTLHDAGTGGAAPTPPIIRQNKWSSRVTVPLGKASLLFSSDDLTTKRQMQVELTAVPTR